MEEFYIWFLFILFSFFLILYGYLHFSKDSNTLSNIFGFGAIFSVFINILIFLPLMYQNTSIHAGVLTILTLSLGLPIILIGITVIISTGLLYLLKIIFKNKDFTAFSENVKKELSKRSKATLDTYRKIPHILIFVGLFVLWYIGVVFVKSVAGTTEGMIPFENNILSLYLQVLTIPNSIKYVLLSLGWFYYLLFFFFYIFCLGILANEFSRKTKNFVFPFNIFCNIFLCEEEKQGYGTYLHFAVGHMFAAFVCPPMVFFTILGMSSIADLTTSQIGIRYGKTHIRWNKNKTWEGTIAGVIICFIISIFFVGILWGLIFSLCFLFIDTFTNKPINLSDNLLIPLGIAIIYLLIRFFFNLNYNSIILAWI